ncbi:MAG: hypothetical protein LBL21_04120, partial [Rickettsiales bacterium]|nr:hypothetical protein [Rickettsiales bacterium]
MKNIIALSAAFLTAIRLQGAFADCNGGPDCDSGEYCDWTYDCLPCDEGYYCVKNLSSACASGQWSAQGSSSCSSSHSSCTAGKYSNGSGQLQTLGAADNKYSPAGNCGTIARTNTAGCSAWNTGANECTSCNANRYLSGANCPACPGHSSSSAGSASCACNTGYSADGTWNGAAS